VVILAYGQPSGALQPLVPDWTLILHLHQHCITPACSHPFVSVQLSLPKFTVRLYTRNTMSSDSLGYQSLYESLPLSPGHIRLLILHPNPDPKAVITCSLIRKSLEAAKQQADSKTQHSDSILKFEALSYAWGEPRDEGIIIVNGMNVSIRRNLLHGLQHLRHPGESSSLEKRVLWVDAICIDQQNVSERNHQVSQMGEIYRNAQRVVIWLGLASADSASALLFISSVSDSWKNVKGRSNIPQHEPTVGVRSGSSFVPAAVLAALMDCSGDFDGEGSHHTVRLRLHHMGRIQ
jgi:hypothetical protein